MKQPFRLFDCIETHLESRPNHNMLAGKENGEWREYSTKEVAEIVNSLSAGLLKMGYGMGDKTPEGRDKVAVISKNRPEWVMLDLAVQKIGAVLTPIYPTIGDQELEYILRDAEVEIIFTNDGEMSKKVQALQPNLPGLNRIYSFDKAPEIQHWKEILTMGGEEEAKQLELIDPQIKNHDLATIIYTSGTTGKPKGVMLSHNNILSNVLDGIPCFPPGGENMKALSFLPLNHIFERMVTYIYLFKGTSIYYAESLETIGENLKEVKPEIFTTVPRLLEKVYEKIMNKGNELTGIKRRLFFWAHSLAKRFEINTNQGFFYNLQLSLANKLIFSKWREALGNRVVCIISGGAACQVRLIRIFTAARMPIMEGYGLTETSPVISVNRYEEENRMFGTVGPLIDNVQVQIAEDGEILCKGPNIMIGYYKNPGLTKDTFTDDGWFKTGDIGTIVSGKFLKITDRKKEMFKTSGGKYVAPVEIENKMKESPFIEHFMVIGEGEKFVSALIVPSFANLIPWCKERNISTGNREEMLANSEVHAFYREIIDRYNLNFGRVEQVKKFVLLPADWSIETGELTPKLSMRRKIIFEKYGDLIHKLYEHHQ